MAATLGRSLVTAVVTRFGLGTDTAEQVVGYVLAEAVADLLRCRQAMVQWDSPVAIGVGTAMARLEFGADRTRWRKRHA